MCVSNEPCCKPPRARSSRKAFALCICLLEAMGNRRISAELKECALNLWAKGWELKDITDTLIVSQASSLYRWRAIFEEHKSVTKLPSTPLRYARNRLIRAVLTASRTVYTSTADPDLYLDELVLWLALRHDIAISVPALQEILTEAGLTREILLSIALERDEVLSQQ